MTDPRAGALIEQLGAVLDRWTTFGLIRFRTSDDAQVLLDELVRTTLAVPSRPASCPCTHCPGHFALAIAEWRCSMGCGCFIRTV